MHKYSSTYSNFSSFIQYIYSNFWFTMFSVRYNFLNLIHKSSGLVFVLFVFVCFRQSKIRLQIIQVLNKYGIICIQKCTYIHILDQNNTPLTSHTYFYLLIQLLNALRWGEIIHSHSLFSIKPCAMHSIRPNFISIIYYIQLSILTPLKHSVI